MQKTMIQKLLIFLLLFRNRFGNYQSVTGWSDLSLFIVRVAKSKPAPGSLCSTIGMSEDESGWTSTSSESPTVLPTASLPSRDTIIGAVVGSVVAALLLAAAVVIFIVWRLHKNKTTNKASIRRLTTNDVLSSTPASSAGNVSSGSQQQLYSTASSPSLPNQFTYNSLASNKLTEFTLIPPDSQANENEGKYSDAESLDIKTRLSINTVKNNSSSPQLQRLCNSVQKPFVGDNGFLSANGSYKNHSGELNYSFVLDELGQNSANRSSLERGQSSITSPYVDQAQSASVPLRSHHLSSVICQSPIISPSLLTYLNSPLSPSQISARVHRKTHMDRDSAALIAALKNRESSVTRESSVMETSSSCFFPEANFSPMSGAHETNPSFFGNSNPTSPRGSFSPSAGVASFDADSVIVYRQRTAL